MTLRLRAPACFAFALACATAPAQQLIGYVNTHDAEVAGASDVLNGQAVLTGSAAVTARDHTAPITLGRGGTVRVCQTSALHVTESRSSSVAAPLLFSLDHGAIEIQMAGTLNDSIMTPDLRFTVVNAGPLDLRLRVAANGDTCVENRGPSAPTLDISDPFGETMYQVSAGQHVLFEHGSLHEVVDQEKTPCGCPEAKAPSVADALMASGIDTKLGAPKPADAPVTVAAPVAATPAPSPASLQTAEQIAAQAAVKAAEAHPFPEAISEGLAPPAEVPQASPGATHVQIADTLVYNAPPLQPAAAATPAPPEVKGRKPRAAKGAAPAASSGPPPPPASAPPPRDLVHVVGRFFRRLFGG
jgi:hypothetical protein